MHSLTANRHVIFTYVTWMRYVNILHIIYYSIISIINVYHVNILEMHGICYAMYIINVYIEYIYVKCINK